MGSFQSLFSEYEKTTDVASFFSKHSENDESLRFLLIRSLDKSDFENLTGTPSTGKISNLMSNLYDTDITVNELISYIKSQKPVIEKERSQSESGLSDIIKDYGPVHCGLRNDKVDDLVKSLVRDKNIKTVSQLNSKIDEEIIPRIRNYISWSFYNQVTNDLIEHYFIRHPRVIPTLRKIHDVDFFIETKNKTIPFDLKITHIADDCFDFLSRNPTLAESSNGDQFVADPKTSSESEIIKQFYRSIKKEYDLPNYAQLSKQEMIDILSKISDKEVQSFVDERRKARREMVLHLNETRTIVEWWNYKFQGERLFNNNNRLFIFLAYEDSFEDGRPIKGALDKISSCVNNLLDNFDENDIDTIRYHYDKDPALEGDYVVHSTSFVITEGLNRF